MLGGGAAAGPQARRRGRHCEIRAALRHAPSHGNAPPTGAGRAICHAISDTRHVTSAEIPAKPAEGAAGRTLGNRRPTWFVVVMSIITFGIYTLYWLYKSFAEVRRVRGQGVSGVVGLLLCFVVVGQFLLPAYVGRMYREV